MSKKLERFQSKYDNKVKVGLDIPASEKRTKDSFKDETDINNIMSRYLRTGQLTHLMQRDAKYGDFSDIQSYQDALERVQIANEQFFALPAAVRADVDNDPAKFLKALNDDRWREKHRAALGGVTPPSPASPNPKSDDAGSKASDSKPA